MNIWTTVFFSFIITSFSFLIWNHVSFMFDCTIQKEILQKEYYLMDALMEYATDYYSFNSKNIMNDKTIDIPVWPLGQSNSGHQGTIQYNIQPEKVIVTAQLLKEGNNPRTLSKVIKL